VGAPLIVQERPIDRVTSGRLRRARRTVLIGTLGLRDRIVRSRRWPSQGPLSDHRVRRFGIPALVLALGLATSLMSIANLPWVHPRDQLARSSDVLDNRLDLLERPEAYSDDARQRARDGNLVEPDVTPLG
jgi:hypothetical protein